MMMLLSSDVFFFFFNDTATTEIYTLSLHDALPISLHLAAQQGDVAVVKALLARGVDPNVRTPRSEMGGGRRGGGGGFRPGPSGEQTPLMMAARGNHEETMRALVAAGADPALRAQDGTGVLMAAVSGAKVSTV